MEATAKLWLYERGQLQDEEDFLRLE